MIDAMKAHHSKDPQQCEINRFEITFEYGRGKRSRE